LAVKWDYAGQILQVNEVLPVQITLTISQDISDIIAFSFDTTIIATAT
jgi:hypothetical protein